MIEPRRWLERGDDSPEARLLRAAVNEPFPSAALQRAGRRLGVSSTLLGFASASLASTAAPQALAVGASNGIALVATWVKAVTVGLALGSVMVGAAYWTQPVRSATPRPASSCLSSVWQRAGSKPVDSQLAIPQVRAESGVPTDASAAPAPDEEARAGLPSSSKDASRSTGLPTRARSGNAGTEVLPESMPGAENSATIARFANDPEPPSAIPVAAATATAIDRAPTVTHQGSALAREVRALDVVRDALRSGDARRALDELDRSEQERIFQLLSREAAVLRVEALGGLGRTEQAARLARRLLNAGVSPAQQLSLERWVTAAQP